jgi:glycosyltransferase involved in cell wall biosynthesis
VFALRTKHRALKPTILTFIRYYLPGYKSGGPVRTIANMVDQLGDEFDFHIITMDRDFGAAEPYQNITVDAWNTVGKAKVYYASPGFRSLNRLVKLVSETAHDVLYFNSAFDPVFTLWPLLNRNLGRIFSRSVVLAPRGEFSEGALALKRWKKMSYLMGARMQRFYRDVIWQASSQYEAEDIRRAMRSVVNNIRVTGNLAQKIVIAPDLPTTIDVNDAMDVERVRTHDRLYVVFLSRITPIKNLDFALRVLRRVSAPVVFNIYGPMEDKVYWRQCEALIASLPGHIQVKYLGEVEHSKVASVIALHDLFFLPTRGENYGHVIAEALATGTPVLIADTTPWRNLKQAGVGRDLPLTAEQPHAEFIDYCAALDATAFRDWRIRVREFAIERLVNASSVDANRSLLMEAAGKEIGKAVLSFSN